MQAEQPCVTARVTRYCCFVIVHDYRAANMDASFAGFASARPAAGDAASGFPIVGQCTANVTLFLRVHLSLLEREELYRALQQLGQQYHCRDDDRGESVGNHTGDDVAP